jgi:hypothetical protein
MPTAVPPGFQPVGAYAGADGSTSVLWRRGFERLVVSVQRAGAEPTDPFATGGMAVARGRHVELGAGALAGRAAVVVELPPTVPHLWASDGRVVVSVSGALPADQLRQIAESLERR